MREAFGGFPSELSLNSNEIALDIEELDDEYKIEADVAGVKKDNIDVTIHNQVLTVEVKTSGEEERKEKNYVCKERWSGSASRSVTLPHAADDADAKANLRDGVLEITVKKAPETKRKRVSVQ